MKVIRLSELVAQTGEGDALLAEAKLHEAAHGGTAGLEAEGRYMPVYVQLAVAAVSAVEAVVFLIA